VCSEVEALSQKDAYLLLFENKKTKIKTKTQAPGHSNSNRFPLIRFPTTPFSAFSCPITGKRNRYDLENTENERTERTVNNNGNKRRIGMGATVENKNEIKTIDRFKTLDDVPIYSVYGQNTHEYDNPNSVYQSANSHLERNRENDSNDIHERAKFNILYRATNILNEKNYNYNNHSNNNNHKATNNFYDSRMTNNYQNKYKENKKDRRIIKVREEPYNANTETNTENENEKEKRKRQLDENSENCIENEEKNKRQKSNNNTALRASVLTQSFIFSKLITLGKLTKLSAENVIKSVKKIIFEPDDTDV
jgi:hypothetical protein